MDRLPATLALIAVLGLSAVAYWPARAVGYVYEDEVWMAKIHEPATGFPNRAVTMASLRLTETRPDVAHLVNVGIHLLNGWLLYRVARRWWVREAALAAAALLLLHPLSVEAVAYLHGRADLLVTTGWLLAAVSSRWWLIVAGLLLACLSKEIGVAGAVVALAARRVSVELLVAAVCLLCVVGLPVLAVWVGLNQMARWDFLWLQLAAVGQMAVLVVYPVWLSIDHDPLTVSAWVPWVLLSATALIALSVLGGSRAWALAWLWIAAAVLPRFVVFGVETINEHQMYPAMVGISLALVVAIVRVSDVVRGYGRFARYTPLPGWTGLERIV